MKIIKLLVKMKLLNCYKNQKLFESIHINLAQKLRDTYA